MTLERMLKFCPLLLVEPQRFVPDTQEDWCDCPLHQDTFWYRALQLTRSINEGRASIDLRGA